MTEWWAETLVKTGKEYYRLIDQLGEGDREQICMLVGLLLDQGYPPREIFERAIEQMSTWIITGLGYGSNYRDYLRARGNADLR